MLVYVPRKSHTWRRGLGRKTQARQIVFALLT